MTFLALQTYFLSTGGDGAESTALHLFINIYFIMSSTVKVTLPELSAHVGHFPEAESLGCNKIQYLQ